MVVVATGGSGTRVLVRILESFGFYMGVDQNHAGDAMSFGPVLDRFVNPVLSHTQAARYSARNVPAPVKKPFRAAMLRAAAKHLRALPDPLMSLGFKNPRHIFLLPVIAPLFPGLRVIHLVRDGRDMALSTNRNQVNRHFTSLFRAPLRDDRERAAIRLWSVLNVEAATWARYALGTDYCEVRFEDLCAHPEQIVDQVAGFLAHGGDSIDPAVLATAASRVQPPASVGRWRDLSSSRLGILEAEGQRGLDFFGYQPAVPPAGEGLFGQEQPVAQSPAVAVLGMHRGGTSATAGVLAESGWGFGSALMPSSKDNPDGYWENEKLVALSHRMLTALRRDWLDIRPLPEDWLEEPEIEEMAEEAVDALLDERGGSDLFAVKDPRMSLLAGIWVPILRRAFGRDPRVLMVLRNPLSVAASLEARDSIERDAGLWLWMLHMIEADAATRAIDRLIIDFDMLIDDPSSTRSRILGFLEGDWDSGGGSVRPELMHHRVTTEDVVSGKAVDLAMRLYRDLLRMVDDDSRGPRAAVSRTRRVIQDHLDGAAPVIRQLTDRLCRVQDEAEQSQAALAHVLLTSERQQDALSLVAEPVEAVLDGWRARYERQQARDDDRPFFAGYAQWIAHYEARSIDVDDIKRFFRDLGGVPSVDLVRLEDASNPLHQRGGVAITTEIQAIRADREIAVDVGSAGAATVLNRTIAASKATYLAFHRSDYALTSQSLARLVAEAVVQPSSDLIYGDEDRLDADGNRCSPWFKGSNWDPDEHLERDRLGGLVLVRREALQAAGPFSGDGAEDPVFALPLMLERTGSHKGFEHVPFVLTSSRRPDGPALRASSAREALVRDRYGDTCTVEPGVRGDCVRLRYHLPPEPPRVTIIIPTRDGGDHLERSIGSVLNRTTYPDFEIIVVDNGTRLRFWTGSAPTRGSG